MTIWLSTKPGLNIMLMKTLNDEILKDVICFGDLYKKLGFEELSFKNGGFLVSINQVKANKKTLDYLHKVFLDNVKNSKDKRVKAYRKEYRDKVVAWDFMLWAPETNESIPDMAIGLDEDKEKYDKLS